ncbi:MAG: diguanylate cyclase, partial [Gaiellaceae bacterium]
SEQWAVHGDMSRLSALGVDSDHAYAIPLLCDEQLLGALLIASERRAVVDRSTATTVAGLVGAVLSTSRRLALSADEARRDPLTGLPNKRAFRELLERRLGRQQPEASPVSLVLLDIDDFKRINDTRGHPTGDRVLRQVARVVLRALRADEEAFRVGGEEFALVVAGADGAGARVAERVRAALAESTRETLPTISAGVAEAVGAQTDVDELVARADAALYQAKADGKNRVVVAGHDADREPAALRHRSRSVLRALALAELPHVARAWLVSGTSSVGVAAFKLACRHLASTVNAAGACVSLTRGERLVREAVWFNPHRAAAGATVDPILTRAAEIPLPGAPRVARSGARSALLCGLIVDGRLVGVAEVYDESSRMFSSDDVHRVALANREVAALVARRSHAETLRDRYRTNVVSLCTVASGQDAIREQIDDAGRFSRELAEACGLGRRSALACELASLLMASVERDVPGSSGFGRALVGAMAASDPLHLSASVVGELRQRRAGGRAAELSREAALVEAVLAYFAAHRRHEARGAGALEALAEIVDDTSARRPPSVVEALVRVVQARLRSRDAREDHVEVGQLRGLVCPGGGDPSVVADQER